MGDVLSVFGPSGRLPSTGRCTGRCQPPALALSRARANLTDFEGPLVAPIRSAFPRHRPCHARPRASTTGTTIMSGIRSPDGSSRRRMEPVVRSRQPWYPRDLIAKAWIRFAARRPPLHGAAALRPQSVRRPSARVAGRGRGAPTRPGEKRQTESEGPRGEPRGPLSAGLSEPRRDGSRLPAHALVLGESPEDLFGEHEGRVAVHASGGESGALRVAVADRRRGVGERLELPLARPERGV